MDLMQRFQYERERVQVDDEARRLRIRLGPEHAGVEVPLW
jgi:hypothetical protein